MEGKTNFSRRLKQFDSLTCCMTDPDPHISGQIYTPLHGSVFLYTMIKKSLLLEAMCTDALVIMSSSRSKKVKVKLAHLI